MLFPREMTEIELIVPKAAGCTAPGTLAEVKQRVYEALGAVLP